MIQKHRSSSLTAGRQLQPMLSMSTTTSLEPPMSIGRIRVIVAGLNLRPSPGTGNTPIRVLVRGDVADVLAPATDGWYRVRTIRDSREGFVSSSPSYVEFTARHTTEADLVVVPTPYPTATPVLLHPRAAAAFELVLAFPGLTTDDVKALCRINSSFRSWDSQMALVRRYEVAIGTPWTPWSKLTAGQLVAAKAAGFAYHPGNPPVDAPHTHVGGGAMDIQAPLPERARSALVAHGFRLDTPGDAVHWGWHGA